MILAEILFEEYLQKLDQVELHEDHLLYYEIVSWLLQLMALKPRFPQPHFLCVLPPDQNVIREREREMREFQCQFPYNMKAMTECFEYK
jgi:hypothetical protein